MFSLFYDGWRDMSVVVTYWADIMFYEERVPTRWNHEQHDEINPMEATTIQRLRKSKFVDKVQVKRRSFHTRKVEVLSLLGSLTTC